MTKSCSLNSTATWDPADSASLPTFASPRSTGGERSASARDDDAAAAPSQLRIALVCDVFNSMAQRLYVEVIDAGHVADVHEVNSSADIVAALSDMSAIDMVVCPFLSHRVPASVYERADAAPLLIVHPGIEGDRGMSSLDWALRDGETHWGVTLLQAADKMDAGPIWSTHEFAVNTPTGRAPTKSSLYRSRCADAAARCVLDAIAMRQRGVAQGRALDYSDARARGRYRRRMKQADRAVDWLADAADVCRRICASDSQPGTLAEIQGRRYYMYGASVEAQRSADIAGVEPQTLLGQRDGAVLIACGRGAVWISHLKKADSAAGEREPPAIKLPAMMVLPADVGECLPLLSLDADAMWVPWRCLPQTFQEIYCWRNDGVAMLWFDFYNGAMSTAQCERLGAALDRIEEDHSIKVLVLMGGDNFFSNGIHLNTIEAAADPELESWRNINAIDDVVKRVLCSSKRTISALQGNAGAGGAMMALAADLVWLHSSVVLNVSYAAMALFGSEYWTFSLPRRVGTETAERLTRGGAGFGSSVLSARMACNLGVADEVLCVGADAFVETTMKRAQLLAEANEIDAKPLVDDEFKQCIQQCRDRELREMKVCFASSEYARRRHAFVYKHRMYSCCSSCIAAEKY